MSVVIQLYNIVSKGACPINLCQDSIHKMYRKYMGNYGKIRKRNPVNSAFFIFAFWACFLTVVNMKLTKWWDDDSVQWKIIIRITVVSFKAIHSGNRQKSSINIMFYFLIDNVDTIFMFLWQHQRCFNYNHFGHTCINI